MNGDDHLLKPEQVAERLSVSVDWVRDHSSRKMPRLPVIRLGGGPGRAGLLRYRASEIGTETTMVLTSNAGGILQSSADAREARRAFVEKRKPTFRGI